MRVDLAYKCGCFLTMDLEPWRPRPEEELRACRVHRGPAGQAGLPAPRPLSLSYHEEGGGD